MVVVIQNRETTCQHGLRAGGGGGGDTEQGDNMSTRSEGGRGWWWRYRTGGQHVNTV